MELNGVGLLGILLLAHPLLNQRSKGLHVGVDCGVAVGVIDVENVAVAIRADSNARHITIVTTEQVNAFAALRFDVQSSVEVVFSEFAKVARERHGDINGSPKPQVHVRRRGLCRGLSSPQTQGQAGPNKQSCHHLKSKVLNPAQVRNRLVRSGIKDTPL